MKLYDTMIRRICELEQSHSARFYPYRPQKAWPENEDYECIFQKETAITLGASGTCGCNMICVTTDPKYFHGDQVTVIGPDLEKLRGNIHFVRITLLLTEEILPEEGNGKAETNPSPSGKSVAAATTVRSTEKAFRILQQMDFVKYHIYPKGYMVRASGQSSSEQVRVSRKAMAHGISFERIGDTYLKHYKENPRVLQARVIFITAPDIDYGELNAMSRQAEELRNSLSVIMKGIATDCGSCGIREICNEIEGLRELHFGREKEKS